MKPLSEKQFVALWHEHGSAKAIAKLLGQSERAVLMRRRAIEQRLGVVLAAARKPGGQPAAPAAAAKPAPEGADAEVRALRAQLAALKGETLDAAFVRRKIFKLAEAKVDPPDWLLPTARGAGHLGVPTLFASDWHWAEVVDSRQIGGVNSFDLSIAHARARRLIERTVFLLRTCFAGAKYPGIVFALGGDMVSGDIHDELSATNEIEIMPTVIDLVGVLAWCIRTLADEFGRVFVPAVTGNHGRNTNKIRAKGRAFTSFDWLAYSMLELIFEKDRRVQFMVPEGPDASFSVYGTRYLLTHGDQFRGGDGMIGALGPIIRGDHRKRGRNGQVGAEYDVLLIGHWHQLIQLQRIIVNGSLKGYDEYAYSNNFPFERPRQALWITHPEHGITFSMPVNVDTPADEPASAPSHWVAWQES